MKYHQSFENLVEEIKINIFKYVNHPLNLAQTCRNWSIIAKDPYAKFEWLLEHYEEEHALFHAVRLGVTFIDMTLCQSLIERKVITSRYFIQILLMHFRVYNQKLIELRLKHDFNKIYINDNYAYQQKINPSWSRNLLIFVFAYLLNERQSANAKKDLLSNDMMEPSRIISVNPRINNAFAEMLRNNLKEIEYLIYKLISKSSIQLDLNNTIYAHKLLLFLEKYSLENKFDAIKYFDSLQEENLTRSLTILPLFVNNIGTFKLRTSSRNVIQRIRDRPTRQNTNRIYKIYRRRSRRGQFNEHETTLNTIANLPRQTSNDPLVQQFFNGSPFN
ncbi:hypothetical protein RclHR1_07970003 [Rhizophagus clarus]|uniref:F-box domain-containing protein n=1 Tax=Rhizophagus clarus TaxID=94130 RepID=A0A2Z6S143_9GLOM|nr:hypothetical protein RclHR1_07970003 [Rhizophagus clarus]